MINSDELLTDNSSSSELSNDHDGTIKDKQDIVKLSVGYKNFYFNIFFVFLRLVKRSQVFSIVRNA
jgi:hypothetical protein